MWTKVANKAVGCRVGAYAIDTHGRGSRSSWYSNLSEISILCSDRFNPTKVTFNYDRLITALLGLRLLCARCSMLSLTSRQLLSG